MEIKDQVIQAQSKIIDRLTLCEEAISELYALYSTLFPGQKEFWAELSHEEQTHANLLQSMHGKLDNGMIFHNIGRFDVAGIESFLITVNKAIADAKEKSVTPLQGIQMGILIESSLLESHFYDIVKADDEVFTAIAGRLSEDTQKHVKTVQNKLIELQSDLSN